MTAGELLKILTDNPDKEIQIVRYYLSDTNGKLSSYGYRTLQNLGGISVQVLEKTILITVDSET